MVDRMKNYRTKVDIFYITKDDLIYGTLIASKNELTILIESNTILSWDEVWGHWLDEYDHGHLDDESIEKYCEPI